MLQHTPRAVTEAPPSSVILPPEVAEVEVMDETAVVVIVAKVGARVVKLTVLP